MKSLIKKETIIKIEEEIRNKTTIPNVLKEKIKKSIFTNIIIAVSMIIYFTFLIKGSEGAVKAVRSVDFNIFSILILTLSIYLFEIAYRKDNGRLAIYGIETLLVAIVTLFFPYIIFELDQFYKKYYMIVSACIAVYYTIKSICIIGKIKKIHIKQSSDINEIIKKEKRKKVETVKEKNDKHKETNVIDSEFNDKKDKNTKIEKVETAPKKRGRPKKNIESIDTKKEESKKVEKTDTKNKTKESNTPKKRGRPRKVDIKND